MDFIYIDGKPEGSHERRVAAEGYKWVRTNHIGPTMPYRVNSLNHTPDRLPAHYHHGESTHRVVKGDLRIHRHNGDYSSYEISSTPGAQRQDLVPPNTKYSGTSKNGCSFVEGHRSLSPSTAERFIQRGTLRAVNNGGIDACPDEETLKKWLVQVEFNPHGKAYPNHSTGEKPILDIRNTDPPMPGAVHIALSTWFENEWKPQAPAAGVLTCEVFAMTLAVLFVAWIFWTAKRVSWCL
ncbi:hypothetical protein F4861DRAFT_96598 [Xylaria intraflava]|nr:hypothetical protein F4861DRAFT_96598 [Xylaria intraflava]